MVGAIETWLKALASQYEAETDEQLIRRFTGWKAGADVPALLYAVLAEMKFIRAALERQPAEGRPTKARR